MYHHHHMLWSCMSSSNLRKGLILFRGYRLSTAITQTLASSTNNNRWLSSSSSSSTVSTNNNRWLSTSSSSSGGAGGKGIMISTTKKRGFPRIPWLCLSPTYNGRILPVFDPSGRCFYDIPIPKELQGPNNSVRGSGHGWLVMVKGNDELNYADEPTEMILSLYDPITRAHIPLPPVIPPGVLDYGQVWCNPTKASPGQPIMSILSMFDTRILIYNKGDDDWSTEIVTEDKLRCSVYNEVEDKLYIVYADGRLSVIDLPSYTLRPIINTPSPQIESLGVSAWIVSLLVGGGAAGDLLLVVKTEPPQPPQYHVFKLDKRCLKWVRTTNIGNHTLFGHQDNNHVLSIAWDQGITDARANQIYIFKFGRTYPATRRQVEETDTNILIEVSGDVQVCDLISAEGAPKSTRKGKRAPLFKTSKILRGAPLTDHGYVQFAAWMVPSLS